MKETMKTKEEMKMKIKNLFKNKRVKKRRKT
jgi:hypothetical protein